MIASVTEAHEESGVSTINIPGAYLHNGNDKYVIILSRGGLVELVALVDPKLYQKYETTIKIGKFSICKGSKVIVCPIE